MKTEPVVKNKLNSSRRLCYDKQATLKLAILVLFFVIIIDAFLSHFGFFCIQDSFVKYMGENFEQDMFNNLFSVQATIATLSIAIIALITGCYNETVFGVSVTEYVTSIKPYIFKHKIIIFADFILTAINYFLVAKGYYNASVVLFLLSITLSCFMVKDISFIFSSKTKLYEEIRDYVLDNYLKSFDDLKKGIINNLNAGNASFDYRALDLITEMFQKNLNNEQFSKEFIDATERFISDLITDYQNQYSDETNTRIFGTVIKLYKIANNHKPEKIPLSIWDNTYREYFSFISKLDYYKLFDNNGFDIINYYYELQRNRAFTIDEEGNVKQKNAYYLEFYPSWIYREVYFTKKNSGKDINVERLKRFFKFYFRCNHYSTKIDTENVYADYKELLELKEVCLLTRALIEVDDEDIISKDVFYDLSLNYKNDDYDLFILITAIYLYYLSCKEPLTDGTPEQKNAKNIIKIIRNKLHYFFYSFNYDSRFTEKAYKKIKYILNGWERFEEGEAKTIIMESVINEFIIFSYISSHQDNSTLRRIIDIISEKNAYWIYSKYYSNAGTPKDLYNSFYEQFVGNPDERIIKNNLERLKTVLITAYQEEGVSEGIEKAIDDQSLQEFVNKLKESYLAVSNNICQRFTATKKDGEQSQITSLSLFRMYADNELINGTYPYDELFDHFPNDASLSGILYVLKDHIKTETISYLNEHKQQRIIELAQQECPSANTAINASKPFWEEEKPDMLSDYSKDMYQLSMNKNDVYLLDGNLIRIAFKNIRVIADKIGENDFNDLGVKNENGTLSYNLVNDAYVSFEKDELMAHLNRTRRRIEVIADVEYYLSGTVGVGIHIDFNNPKSKKAT